MSADKPGQIDSSSSYSSSSNISNISNITPLSPRVRSVTVQGLEAPERKGRGARNGLSPALSRLDIGNAHSRANSMPLEIHTRQVQSARPILSNSFKNNFGTTPNRLSSSFWEDDDLLRSRSRSPSSIYDRQPLSAGGIEPKKSWENLSFVKAPSLQPPSHAAPFSPSTRTNSAMDHPWLSSSVNDSASVWQPSSPKLAPAIMSTDALGNALGKLSVATNFASDLQNRNVGSLSAIPFKEQAGFFPTTPIDRSAFAGVHSSSAYPDSFHANRGFFPDSPVSANPMSNSAGAHLTKPGYPADSYGPLRSSSAMAVGSPLATSFGEDRTFGEMSSLYAAIDRKNTESPHSSLAFFPGSPVASSPISSPWSTMGLAEPVSTKQPGFPVDSYGPIRTGSSGMAVGSPLATSFGEDRPFGEMSSVYARSLGRRQVLRDVWSQAKPTGLPEDKMLHTSPSLSEGNVNEGENIIEGLENVDSGSSLVSPPVTPQRSMHNS